MKMKKLIAMILTVCMIITYMPVTAYADQNEPASEENEAGEVLSSENDEEELQVDSEYLEENCEEDIIENESGIDYNTYDLGDGARAQVFFSYPVRYEDENGDLIKIEPEFIGIDSKTKETANGSDLRDYAYENKVGTYKTYIPEELSEDTPILMENEKYSFSMAPSTDLMTDTGSRIEVSEDKATYGTDESDVKLEYISQNDGVKENIILNENPDSNEFSFTLKFDNIYYRENPTDSGITLYDKETGNIVMGIAAPFMNDATGEAYSEDIEVEILEVRNEAKDKTTTETRNPEVKETSNTAYTEDAVTETESNDEASETDLDNIEEIIVSDTESDEVTDESAGTEDISEADENDTSEISDDAEDTEVDIETKEDAIPTYSDASELIMTLKVSEEYLNDPDRVYPVTIDPTATWLGSSQIHDAYIISGYATTNFYSSSTKVMVSGKGSQGKNRTCINILNIKSALLGYGISSASFDIYETGGGMASKVVRVHRITQSWQAGSVTWNTCPSYADTYIAQQTSNGNNHHKLSFNVKSWISSIASGGSNYGLMLRNQVEASTSYTEFYGSRTGATSYRPKLTVVYTDTPSAPTSVTVPAGPYRTGNSVSVTWAGITAKSLSQVQYRVERYKADGTAVNTSYVSWTTIGSSASSGTKAIPNVTSYPAGLYKIYLRGKSTTGETGSEKGTSFNIEDVPTTPSSVTVSPSTIYTGDNITIGWAGLTGSYLKTVQYMVEKNNNGTWTQVRAYATLKTDPGTSGNGSVTVSGFSEPGSYRVSIRGKNTSSITGSARTQPFSITQDKDPVIGSMSLIKGTLTLNDDIYVTGGTITVNVSGISDDRGIQTGSGAYAVTLNNAQVSSGTCTLSGTGSYSAPFEIDGSVFTSSGTYTISFTVADNKGHASSIERNINIDNDNPTGEIVVTQYIQDSLIGIACNINDNFSGVRRATLVLYKGTGSGREDPVTLADNFSISKSVDLPTSGYLNGAYELELTVTDNAGNIGIATQALEIHNMLSTPTVTATLADNESLHVTWSYSGDRTDLDKLEYSIDGGSWSDIDISGPPAITSGNFNVNVSQFAGTHYILVRLKDTAGIDGQEVRKDFTVDSEELYVHISEISRGMIKGSILDNDPVSWEIFIKESGASDETYVKLTEGTNKIDNGPIYLMDLSQGNYTSGLTYVIKLKAVDIRGITEESTQAYNYVSTDETAELQSTTHRIIRALDQDYTTDTFRVAPGASSMALNYFSTIISGAWYVDNVKVSENTSLAGPFTGYIGDTPHRIIFIGEDNSNSKISSNDIYHDYAKETVNFATPQNGAIEQEIELSADAVAVRFMLPEVSGVTYSVKVGTGSYVPVTSDTLKYISEINSSIAETDTLTLKAEASNGSLLSGLGSFDVYVSTAVKEYFTVSDLDYWYPSDFRVIDKINYKTYIGWTVPDNLPSGVTYELHRSTEQGFIPSEATVIAAGLTEGNYSDINVNYGVDFYYLIRVKNSSNDYGPFSCMISSAAVDQYEYEKNLGLKEYWSYAEVKTPVGTGYIEKSKGNFVYAESDFSLPNELLPVEMIRTYNSESTSKSSLGYGWTHNYDIELLKLVGQDGSENGNLALRDGQGTIYTFIKSAGSNNFVNSMGKYIKLTKISQNRTIRVNGISETIHTEYTMNTREGVRYFFNDIGKLLYIEEANGHLIIMRYEQETGRLSSIQTDKGLSIVMEYNGVNEAGGAYTIKKMTLPDGSYMEYTYNASGRITQASYHNGTQSISTSYIYDNNGRIYKIKDRKNTEYVVEISDSANHKTVTVSYPEGGEKLRVTAGASAGDGTSGSTVERLIGETIVSKEHDDFSHSQLAGVIIMGDTDIHEITSTEPKDSSYVYADGLMTSETVRAWHNEISTNGTDILSDYTDKTNTYSYEDKLNIGETYSVSGTGAQTTAQYQQGSEWNNCLPTAVTDEIGGETVENDTYQYDSEGNLILHKDFVEEKYELYEYYDNESGGRFKGEIKEKTEGLIEGTSLIPVSVTDISLSYDSNTGKKTEAVSYNSGNTSEQSVTVYDNMGRIENSRKGTRGDNSVMNVEETNYLYDAFGRLTEETVSTYFGDNNLAELTQNSDKKTKRTVRTYDNNGTVTSESVYSTNGDPDTVTNYTYDDLNRLTSSTTSGNGTSVTTSTAYTYISNLHINDGKGGNTVLKALTVTESEGIDVQRITYYDGLGRTVRVTDHSVTTDYSYDRNGKTITEFLYTSGTPGTSAATGILTLNCYDEEGNVTARVVEPSWDGTKFVITDDSVVTKEGFDKKGNTVSSTDALGHTTGFEYDEKDRLISVTLPDPDQNNITRFRYIESVGSDDQEYTSKVTMTDALQNESYEEYDVNGNTIRICDEGQNYADIETISTYDGDGNLLEEHHSAGDYITYSYDSEGRMTVRTEYAAPTGNNNTGEAVQKTEYTYYDNNDKVHTSSDYNKNGNDWVLYHYEELTYDGLGRMTSKAEINGDTVPNNLSDYAITYGYDNHDNITSISYGNNIPSEVSGIDYEYSDGRLQKVKVRVGNTSYIVKVYEYTPWGAVSTVKDYYDFKNDGTKYITLTYSYDSLLRVSQMVYTKNGTAVLERHIYTYDKTGKVLSEENYFDFTKQNCSGYTKLNEIREYSYDDLDRLIESEISDIAEVEGGNGQTEEVLRLETGYTYDKVGNRLTKTEDNITTNYTYNCLNQLVTETTGSDSMTYTYDLNGNQTGITGTAGETTVSKSFTYTPGGMMSDYTDGTDVQHNTYTGDGARISKDDNGNITNYFYQEGSVLYTTGDNESFNLLNVSDIFGTVRNDGIADSYYYYLDDQRGSTINLIDSNADQVASYWYNDFGEVTEHKGSEYTDFVNEVQYTEAIYDNLTGLLYLNARFYDPSTGKFISQDTYRGEQKDAYSWHLYAYCANDPINSIDSSGHFIETLLDVASIGYSTYAFIKKPSIANAAFLVWDIGAALLPVVPGSYIAKGISKAGQSAKLSKATKLKVFIPTKLSDLQRRSGKLLIGSYGKLKNIKFGRAVQRHHIIEKRFAELFDISPDKWDAVVLDKKVHAVITKRFRKAFNYQKGASRGEITAYSYIRKSNMKRIVNEVYYDMPELRKIALNQIDKHFKRSGKL